MKLWQCTVARTVSRLIEPPLPVQEDPGAGSWTPAAQAQAREPMGRQGVQEECAGRCSTQASSVGCRSSQSRPGAGHLGNEWKKPFQGASHAKGIVLEKM